MKREQELALEEALVVFTLCFFVNSYTSTYLTVAFGSKKTLTKVQTQPKEQNLDKR